MATLQFCVISAAVVLSSIEVVGEEVVDMTKLNKKYWWDAETILKSRDKLKVDLAPPGDDTGKITVRMSLHLRKIIELDLERGILESAVWLHMSWHDERWYWEEKHDLPKIRMSANSVWKPDIVLYNNAAEHTTPVEDVKLEISKSGNIAWIPPLHLHSFCEGQQDQYSTGDKLNCTMKLGSWVYSDDRLSPEIDGEGLYDETDEHPNKHWEVADVYAKKNMIKYNEIPDWYSTISFTVTLKRL